MSKNKNNQAAPPAPVSPQPAGGEGATPATATETNAPQEATPLPPLSGSADPTFVTVPEVDPREIDVNSVEDVGNLRAIAAALQEQCAELGAQMETAVRDYGEVRTALYEATLERDELRSGGLWDKVAFQINPTNKKLSELSPDELLAEAQRYHHVEKLLDAQNQQLIRENEALMAELAGSGELLVPDGATGVIAASTALGLGARTEVPIYLYKPLPRKDVPVTKGDCLGYVVLRDGVELSLLVECVRRGLAGDTPPVGR